MSDAKLAFELRREFGDYDDSFDEPEVKDSWGSYGVFRLVGHGKVTSPYCGKFGSFYGCVRSELHRKSGFDKNGVVVDFSGKAYVTRVFNSCHKPSCPVCYKYGWAVRQADRVESRLREAGKRFGMVEHIVLSVPSCDYDLDFGVLRQKAVKILKSRGVLGGCLIFHGFRLNKVGRKYWYFSPHFHVLGFVLGGFGRCRGCKNRVCVGKGNFFKCDGFEARTRQLNLKDGYIVKVLGKRKTVYGTAWYQLHHSSIKVDAVRFHVATWFGSCSYRKLKVTVEIKKRVCPICQHDLVKLLYSGFKRHLLECYGSVKVGGAKVGSFEDMFERGLRVWVECPVKRYSVSYDE